MKAKQILLILCLLSSTLCLAQNKLFDKYAEQEGVSSVYISKAMFQMIPSMDAAGLELMNMKGKIESLQVLSTQSKTLKEEMNKDFSSLINSQYEELMRVRDGKTRATFYVKKKGEQISELIMLTHTDENFSVIQLLGNFTLKDIQDITSNMNK